MAAGDRSLSHFLQTCFYGSDVQMPSGLNWLPVITKPSPGRWEQEHILNDPPGPLSEPGPRRPSGLLSFIHPALMLSPSSSLSPWASSFPLREQSTLPRICFSALCSLELFLQ